MPGNQENFSAAMSMAEGHRWNSQWLEAMQEYQKALEEFPEDAGARGGLGFCYMQTRQWQQALIEYEYVLKNDPGNVIALSKIAELYGILNRHEEAYRSYLQLGDLYAQMGQAVRAEAAWQKTVQLSPDNPEPHERLAAYYFEKKDIAAMIQQRLAAAQGYFLRNDLEAARLQCEEVLHADSSNSQAQQLIAQIQRGAFSSDVSAIYTTSNNIEHSANHLLANADSVPLVDTENSMANTVTTGNTSGGNTSIMGNMGSAGNYGGMNNPIPAPTMAGATGGANSTPRRKISANQVTEALKQAQVFQDQGRFDDAIDLCEQILDSGFDRPDARYFLGWLYQEQQRWDEAIRQFQLLLNDPDYALSCYYALGQCYRARGDFRSAALHFDEAVDRVNLDALTVEESDQLVQLCQEAAEAHRMLGEQEQAFTVYNALLGFLRSRGWSDKVAEVELMLQQAQNAPAPSRPMTPPAANTSHPLPPDQSPASQISMSDASTMMFNASQVANPSAPLPAPQNAPASSSSSGELPDWLTGILNEPERTQQAAPKSMTPQPPVSTADQTVVISPNAVPKTPEANPIAPVDPPAQPAAPSWLTDDVKPVQSPPPPAAPVQPAAPQWQQAQGQPGSQPLQPPTPQQPAAQAPMPPAAQPAELPWQQAQVPPTGQPAEPQWQVPQQPAAPQWQQAQVPPSSQPLQPPVPQQPAAQVQMPPPAVQPPVPQQPMAQGYYLEIEQQPYQPVPPAPASRPAAPQQPGLEDLVNQISGGKDNALQRAAEPVLASTASLPENVRAQVVRSMQDIQKYISHGLLTSATEECLRVIDMAPQYLDVHQVLCEIYVRQGKIEQAITKYGILVDTYVVNGRIDDAITTYRRILQLEPNNIKYRTRLIELLSSQGSKEDLLRERTMAAESYLRLGYMDRAVAELEEALKESPTSVPTRLNYALALQKLGRVQQSVAEYQRVLQIDPRNITALVRWHVAMVTTIGAPRSNTLETITRVRFQLRGESQQRIEAVLREYQQAVELYPDNADLHFAQGQILQQMGHFDRAVDAYLLSAARDSSMEVIARASAAQCYLVQGKPEAAIQQFEQALQVVRRSPTAIDPATWAARPREEGEEHKAPEVELSLQLANAYGRIGRQDQMQAIMRQVKQHKTADDEVSLAMAEISARGNGSGSLHEYMDLVRHYRNSRQIDNALAVLNEMVRLDPQDPRAHDELADIYIHRGLLDEGIAELRLLADIYIRRNQMEQAGAVVQRMGNIYAEMGDNDEALAALCRAAELNPESMELLREVVGFCMQMRRDQQAAKYQTIIARHYFETHQVKESVAALQQLIAIDRNSLEAYDMLGQTYQSVGEYEQASRVYRNLAKVHPGSPVARERLATLQSLRTS
jgi:tetratricopeptide (TPR) repeat protein